MPRDDNGKFMSTGLSEKKAAKLSEFSLNFPKLSDWLRLGLSVCQAEAKAVNSNRGKFFCTSLYTHSMVTTGRS